MSGVVPLVPRFKFWKNGNNPVSNGSVTVYLAGTTTLADTYQDADLQILNTNPVNLDGNGECMFWTDPSKNYKFLVTTGLNGTGSTVSGWPVDNIPGSGRRERVAFEEFGGVVGNGVNDDTTGMQAALSSGAKFIYANSAATYIINSTLTVPAGVFVDFRGATVKAGSAKAGNLDALGLHFEMSAGSSLTGAVISPSATAYTLGGVGYKTAIRANNAPNVTVKGNTITLTGTGITDSISILNTSDYCSIQDNVCTATIRYSDGGARFTRCTGNTVINATQNGLSGVGNNARAGYGCVVDGNRIVNPARMGIEDFQQAASGFFLRGSRIVNNTIVGGATATFYAISLAGYETVCEGNQIIDWPNVLGIESGSELGHIIKNNQISWPGGNANAVNGIQVNPTTAAIRIAPNQIEGNVIQGADVAIRLVNAPGKSTIRGNCVSGCRLFLLPDVTGTEMVVTNNIVKVTTQTAASRTQLQVWSNSVVEGNSITYESGFDGGTVGSDQAIVVSGSNTIVQGNIVNANGFLTNGVAPRGFTSNGATGSGVRFLNNSLVGGATASYQFFTELVAENNNVAAGISSVATAKRAFYDTQTTVVKPAVTGSRAANAALASLLTQLAAQGLLTDSSTA